MRNKEEKEKEKEKKICTVPYGGLHISDPCMYTSEHCCVHMCMVVETCTEIAVIILK